MEFWEGKGFGETLSSFPLFPLLQSSSTIVDDPKPSLPLLDRVPSLGNTRPLFSVDRERDRERFLQTLPSVTLIGIPKCREGVFCFNDFWKFLNDLHADEGLFW
ncbi:uncharacterized protein LOC131245526 [Magnolia sinica]|uniref:uncharacterized protein LOC131245526 n=1 Tax=Magnolia sinica TaxID=86752 RepID=UPI0026583C1D|nr:uncharacterized protein LOC131245526 [Magnolia sinica]